MVCMYIDKLFNELRLYDEHNTIIFSFLQIVPYVDLNVFDNCVNTHTTTQTLQVKILTFDCSYKVQHKVTLQQETPLYVFDQPTNVSCCMNYSRRCPCQPTSMCKNLLICINSQVTTTMIV